MLSYDPAAFVPVTVTVRLPYGLVVNPNMAVAGHADIMSLIFRSQALISGGYKRN